MYKLYLFIAGAVILSIGCNEKAREDVLDDIVKTVPQIATISKSEGFSGDTLEIIGNGFLDNATVKFGDVSGTIIERNNSIIRVIIPLGAGTISVKVFNRDYSSNAVPFTFKDMDGIGGNRSIINVQGTLYFVDTTAFYPVGPGATYLQLDLNDTGFYYAPTKVHLITYDVNNQYLTFKPVAANDRAITTETVPDMATRKSAAGKLYFAGVNGDFFRSGLTDAWYGQPYQGLMIDGEIVSSPRPLSSSDKNTGGIDGHIFFEDSKKMFVDYAIFKGSGIYNGTFFNIDAINKYRDANHIIWSTNYLGPTSNQNNYGSEVSLMPVNGTILGPNSYNKDLEMQVTSSVSAAKPGMSIPENGIILSGHPDAVTAGSATIVKTMTNGAPLTARFDIWAAGNKERKFDQMVGGRAIILKNGIINDTNWVTRYPRTSMGVSADGNKVYMFVADAPGFSTQAVARIMQLYGAYSALNLMSYGESTMYIRNLGSDNTGFVNNPGRATPALNSEGIFAVSSAPDDNNIAQFAPGKRFVRLKTGDTFTPIFHGINQYGLVVSSPLSGVALSGGEAVGSISGDTFTATTAGAGELTATYAGKALTIKVVVKNPE